MQAIIIVTWVKTVRMLTETHDDRVESSGGHQLPVFECSTGGNTHALPTNGSTHWQIMTDIKKIIDQQIAQQRRGGQDISVIEVDLPAIPDVGRIKVLEKIHEMFHADRIGNKLFIKVNPIRIFGLSRN